MAGEYLRKYQALEAETEIKNHTASVVVIVPGFNVGKDAYYTPQAIAEAVKSGLFEGRPMYLNHTTNTSPDRDIDKYVAILSDVTLRESDGAAIGTAKLFDPPFGAKLLAMREAGCLNSMGVSIDAYVDAEPGEMEGQHTRVVKAFHRVNSVDFTPAPGAGGGVLAVESEKPIEAAKAEPKKESTMDLEQLKAENEALKAQVAALTAELDKMRGETEEAAKKATEAAENAAKATAATECEKALSASGLPEMACARVRESLAGNTDTAKIATVIDAEKRYLESLKINIPEPTVTGLGHAATGATPTNVFESVKSRYIREGHSPEKAERLARAYCG